jgi:1-acyl-sn-glycerol-3-phosphate acyltransferase
MRQLDVPWARCRVARMAREAILQFVLGPLIRLYTRARVYGRERFEGLPPPVVLVANHTSHLDTPTILRALPLAWRQRTAVAAAADYFYKKRVVANLVALSFNTVPILRSGGGGSGSGSFDHVDQLIDQRWNLLMFPEGTRSRAGELGKLHSGAAVIAQQHGIPIVPIHVRGTYAAMPPGRNWPKRIDGFLSHRHRVEVHFGPPIWPAGDEDRAAVMRRVRRYLEGAPGAM